MFKVYEEEKKDSVIRVKLIQEEDGVLLITTDEDGNQDWCLLKLTDNGKIHLCGGIDDEEGIQVNENGYIIIENIDDYLED